MGAEVGTNATSCRVTAAARSAPARPAPARPAPESPLACLNSSPLPAASIRREPPRAVLLFALAIASAAEPAAIDAALIRPTWAVGAIPGFDTPLVRRAGAVRVGMVVQLERDPLYLYDGNTPVSPIVQDRLTTNLGASVDLSKRLAARVVLPIVATFGMADSKAAGVGDLSTGVKLEILDGKTASLGARTDLYLPLGTPGLYAGEASIRFAPGGMLAVHAGRLDVLSDVGFLLRSPVTTTDALALGSEVTFNLGASYDVVPRRLRAYAGALSRVPIESAASGAGALPIEALAGGEVTLGKHVAIELAGGRGLTGGYGTTRYRVLAALTWRWSSPTRAVQADPRVDAVDRTRELLDIEGLTEPPSTESHPMREVYELPLARIEVRQIAIRDPIQFDLGTETILAASQPTLAAVARLMNQNSDIAQLIIEGHASDEGGFSDNYDLSVRRALAAYRALVEAGVHPTRLSCRAYGEVAPAIAGEDAAAMAANRRVIFQIARRLVPGESNPGWDTTVTLPWSGQSVTIPAPPPPPPPVLDEEDEE